MRRDLQALRRKKSLRVLGLMSGTSADGVSLALVRISGNGSHPRLSLESYRTCSFPRRLQRSVLSLDRAKTAELARANFALGEFFAAAVRRMLRQEGLGAAEVDLIGSHGQTVFHEPRWPSGRAATLQIGEPAVIAERTGIPVVADFRSRDIAAGGEGAPLVPFADLALFGASRRRREILAVQNIGGIANVTLMGPRSSEVLGFDTGPGNALLDEATVFLSRGRLRFDRDGRWAARGKPIPELIARLLQYGFFRRKPPKSLDRGELVRDLLQVALGWTRRIGPANLLATLTELTARTIREAVRLVPDRAPDRVILSGGGAFNQTLVRRIQELFRPAEVVLSSELGIHPQAREPMAFAILAYHTIRGRPSNLPAVTGARREVVLGKIVP